VSRLTQQTVSVQDATSLQRALYHGFFLLALVEDFGEDRTTGLVVHGEFHLAKELTHSLFGAVILEI
jgi:hypothetical protein